MDRSSVLTTTYFVVLTLCAFATVREENRYKESFVDMAQKCNSRAMDVV